MRLRAWRIIGLTIVVSLGSATALRAQADTTKPRVRVTKEQPAAPAPTKAPAPVQAPAPTKAPAPTPAPAPVPKEPAAQPAVPTPVTAPVPTPVQPRDDTIPKVSTGDVVTSKDTAAARTRCAIASCPGMMPTTEPRAKSIRYLLGNGDFYFGAGAGTAVPFNLLSDLGYDSGFDLTIPVGWHKPGRTLGLRATFGFDQVHADVASANATAPAMVGSAPDPKIYSATADAVLKFPIGGAVRDGKGLSLYTVGGGGVYLFRGFGGLTQLGDVLGADKIGSSAKNVHKYGVEAGAGMEYGLGPAAVFVESRWVNVFTKGSTAGNKYLRWIPIGVGVTLR